MFPRDLEQAPSAAARITVGIISAIFTVIFSAIVFIIIIALIGQGGNTGVYVILIISLLLLAMFSVAAYRLLIDHKSNGRIFNPYVLLVVCASLFIVSLFVVAAVAHDIYVNGPAVVGKGNSKGLSAVIICPIITGWLTLYSFRKIKRKH